MVLGAVFLAVTGGEALYADIGHFGTAPIRLTWFAIVLPALTLNYFGQGALLLVDPDAAVNPFFSMAPSWALYPMVVLATAAAVIASQAIISGAFSLTMQAIQLGYMPRLNVNYTSARIIGQIYVPVVNWALMLSSHRPRARLWHLEPSRRRLWRRDHHHDADHDDSVLCRGPPALALAGGGRSARRRVSSSSIDLAFFGANMLKVAHGGWFPLLVSGFILFLMLTWRKGRRVLARASRRHLPAARCISSRPERPKHSSRARAPPFTCRATGPARRSRCCTISSTTKCCTNRSSCSPCAPRKFLISTNARDRVSLEKLEEGFWRVQIHFGFMEKPDVPAALESVKEPGLRFDPMRTTYFIGRETILATRKLGLSAWRGSLFAWMTRNAGDVTSYFCLPPNGVVELGARVEV